jgi:hypothetical protein
MRVYLRRVRRTGREGEGAAAVSARLQGCGSGSACTQGALRRLWSSLPLVLSPLTCQSTARAKSARGQRWQ